MPKISGQSVISGQFWNFRNFRTTVTPAICTGGLKTFFLHQGRWMEADIHSNWNYTPTPLCGWPKISPQLLKQIPTLNWWTKSMAARAPFSYPRSLTSTSSVVCGRHSSWPNSFSLIFSSTYTSHQQSAPSLSLWIFCSQKVKNVAESPGKIAKFAFNSRGSILHRL